MVCLLGGDSYLVARVSNSSQKGNVWKFMRRIQASFHMPKECYCTTNGKNYYMVPPALHCMGFDNYLPPLDTRFGTQDYWPKQPKRALAFAKALQQCIKVAKPPQPGKPCHLAECVKEQRRCMRPLTTFTEQ